jgi:hypothetical protein
MMMMMNCFYMHGRGTVVRERIPKGEVMIKMRVIIGDGNVRTS